MQGTNFTGDNGDVAFKITVRSQSRGDFGNLDGPEPGSLVDIDVCHDTVSEAIQGAVENAVQEVKISATAAF